MRFKKVHAGLPRSSYLSYVAIFSMQFGNLHSLLQYVAIQTHVFVAVGQCIYYIYSTL